MLKQWMRRRMVSTLAYDENDDMDGAVRCPVETVSGAVRSPGECHEAWKGHFETAEYVDMILEPGDMLYLPRGWWHYLRSLSTSISLAFHFN